MAVAGVLIGKPASASESEHTRNHLLGFWSLLDEILNSVLFLIIGLEVIAIESDVGDLSPACWQSRRARRPRGQRSVTPRADAVGAERSRRAPMPMLVWGGLRGGISIALALGCCPPVSCRACC